MSNKVYDIVTEKFIDQLKQGTIPWKQPWSGLAAANLVSKKEYRGVNVFMLWGKPYKSPYWVTYKQARNLGGNVKAGEKATMVVFWKMLEKDEVSASGEKRVKKIPLLRYYNVFNVEQCEGIPAEKIPPTSQRKHEPIAEAEAVVKGYENPPSIGHGGNEAYYNRFDDHVQVPPPENFKTGEGYYSTLFHELGHSTRHENRLNREGKEKGKESGAMEELVAEMTAAFLAAHCGFTEMEQPENHVAYIASWLKALQNDPKMVVFAASKAQKAAEYILGKIAKEAPKEDAEEKEVAEAVA